VGKRLLISFAAIAVLASMGTGRAAAQERLTATFLSTVPRGRSHAPVTGTVTFTWRGSGLLEGTLELTAMEGNQVLMTYLSSELALASGEQSFRIMLPPISSHAYSPSADLAMRFITRRGTYNLGAYPLMLPGAYERSLVMCVAQGQERVDRAFSGVLDSLRLETFRPKIDDDTRRRRDLTTMQARVDPEDFPASPMAYCGYDMLVLPRKGFVALKARQLKAISRWVKAGGSVCVFLAHDQRACHDRFLADLGCPDRGRERISIHRFATYRPALGRMVVVGREFDPAGDPTTKPWRRAACFLWKMRDEQLRNVLKHGVWRNDLQRADDGTRITRRRDAWRAQHDPTMPLPLHWIPLSSGSELVRNLMPRSVSLIPFSVIIAILSLFVVVIGPLDYLVLGKLKRRSLTWVLFPAVSLGFMLYTVRLTQHYMGGADHGNALVFMDIGDGGEIVRTNRYELLFTAGQRDIATDVRNGMFAAMDRDRFGGGRHDPYVRQFAGWQGYDPYYGRRIAGPGLVRPEYRGRIPARFEAVQKVHQWTPQLNRTFSLEPSEAGKDLGWDAITVASLRADVIPSVMLDALLGKDTTATSVYLFHEHKVKCQYQGIPQRVTERSSRRHYQLSLSPPTTFLNQASARPQFGLFSVVSAISPTGAANFEDLTVYDPTDENQFLLVVVRKVDDGYHVFRKLYQGG
jgi:hypothetical protein